MVEVQLLFNMAGAIEDSDLSDDARGLGLVEAEIMRLEEDLDKEYINECDDSWDDRTDVIEMFDNKHEVGQTQDTDGLLDDDGAHEEEVKNEEKMKDEWEAGEHTRKVDDNVELKAGEHTRKVDDNVKLSVVVLQ